MLNARNIVIALLIGTAVGIAAQIVTIKKTKVGYWFDTCLSLESCCPDERIIDNGYALCPQYSESFGFPIKHNKPVRDTSTYELFVPNIVLFTAASIGLLVSVSALSQRKKPVK